MNKKYFIIPVLISFLSQPVLALAKDSIRAGTDDYLRDEFNYTPEMLTTPLTTEQREKFQLAKGETSVDDPLGDVLGRAGNSTSMQVPWADIEKTKVVKDAEKQAWEVKVAMGGLVPGVVTYNKAQLFVYVDRDGLADNNDYDGTGADMDAEFSLQYNVEQDWYTDFRWYNQPEDFWAFDQETKTTFEITENTMTLLIPFDEVPANASINWRTIMAVQDGTQTQIDVAPGIGFPPPLGGEYPKEPFRINWPKLSAGWIVLIAAGAVALVYGLWAALSGRMKNCDKK
ncbi:hypothetical protein KJ611_02825 [Patescibacteria group bacterium]|nr:hypothetical protein [Patescibacteria group bacterium]MBU1705217.1 hypothetical protein [Patescibacteria group bacterium]